MKIYIKTLCSIGALMLCSESVLAKDWDALVSNTRASQPELKSIRIEGKELRDYSTSYLERIAPQLEELRVGGEIKDMRSKHNLLALLKKARNLKILRLHDTSLREVPSEVYGLKNLKQLFIKRNKISNISGEIKNLTNLEYLYLTSVGLTELPEEIGELKNLTALNLSFNDITHIPEGVWKLTKLKTFSAVGNKLTNIPKEIGNLKNLEYLNVCGNEIESFPLEMGLLKNLYSLDISCNPALMSQNKWIRKENWSRDKKIEKINRTILGLPSLEYLYLSNKFGSKYGYTSKDLLKIKSQGVIAAEDEAIESATQMFEEAERIAAEDEAIKSATQMFEEAEREAAQAASQVVARESYYSKFGQFFKSIWSRFANSRFSQVLKNIGQTLFSNR